MFIAFIEGGSYLVLLIIIIVNTYRHLSMRLFIHRLILIGVSLQFVASIITAVIYLIANRRDHNRLWVIVGSAVTAVRHFALISLTLLLVAGLSFIHSSLSRMVIAKCVSLPAVFVILEFLCDSQIVVRVFVWWVLIAFVLFALSFLWYWALIDSLSEDSLAVLNAHLAMCLATHFVPATTPSERKKKLVITMRGFARSALGLMIVSIVVQQLLEFAHFGSYLGLAVFAFLLHAHICWTCRLRKAMDATYGAAAEDYEIPDNGELRDWEYGMALPPMPTSVEEQQNICPRPP
jgi:hypothetical protein